MFGLEAKPRPSKVKQHKPLPNCTRSSFMAPLVPTQKINTTPTSFIKNKERIKHVEQCLCMYAIVIQINPNSPPFQTVVCVYMYTLFGSPFTGHYDYLGWNHHLQQRQRKPRPKSTLMLERGLCVCVCLEVVSISNGERQHNNNHLSRVSKNLTMFGIESEKWSSPTKRIKVSI